MSEAARAANAVWKSPFAVLLRGVTYEDGVLYAFGATFVGTALGAYTFGPIPIQWMAQSLIVGVALLLSLQQLYRVPGTTALGLLLAWGSVVTLVNSALGPYAEQMPVLATTPYPVFLALRVMGLLSFASALYVVYWLLMRGRAAEVRSTLVWIGAIFAVVALYVYVAQLYGWWEPVRSRLGTGGAHESGIYAYAFHRASGTFREPSHLAEWLVVPFFLSFVHPGRMRIPLTVAIGSALLLTGSLTGILGISAGIIVALLMTNPFSGRKLTLLLQLLIAFVLALVVFNWLAVSYGPDRISLFEVLQDRIKPILFEGGISQSNRSYAFEYAAAQPLPIFGVGWGHANIVFSRAVGSPLVVSFLSVYLNFLFATGVVGFALLLLFLARPLWYSLRMRSGAHDLYFVAILAAYIAWLVMFTVHSEELSATFGVIMALLTFEVEHSSRTRRTPA